MMLVFGQSGQVARELAWVLPGATFLGRDRADLSDPDACATAIAQGDWSAVINSAAYTAVDRAESEPDLAHTANADSPGAMARACAARGIPFLHVSTDYVFDGSGARPWLPTDATGPLNVYGASKLAGEDAVRASGARVAILRTSWVFSAHGGNFVKTMLRLGAGRDHLRIVADQTGGPTPAADIARALATMAAALRDGHAGGTYHFSGAPDVSWSGFAREIFRQAGIACAVSDIASADYPTPARRPCNSRLNCDTLRDDFAIPRPDWREGLAHVLAELRG